MDPTVKLVRPLRGGQITIPAEFRSALGIDERSLLEVTLTKRELTLRPVKVTPERGSEWVEELYEVFAPVREQASEFNEDEVNADIDEAVASVRRQGLATGESSAARRS